MLGNWRRASAFIFIFSVCAAIGLAAWIRAWSAPMRALSSGISRVQAASAHGTSGSATATLSSNPTAGNTLIAFAYADPGNTISSIASSNTSWTSIGTYAPGSGPDLVVYAAPNVGSSAGTAVTVTTTGSFCMLIVAEYSGLGPAVAVDQTSSYYEYGESASTGLTGTTASANELWINCFANTDAGFADAFEDPTNGYSMAASEGSSRPSYYIALCDQMATTTGQAGGGASEGQSAKNYGYALTLYAAAPAPPTGLTATGGLQQIGLSWNASSNATSYTIYRSPSGNSGTFSSVGTSSTTTYTDTGLNWGTTYWYYVTATDSNGQSGPSNIASALTLPAAPTNVSAVVSGGDVDVSWSSVQSATSYEVVRYQSGPGQFDPVGSTTTTSLVDTNPPTGIWYYAVAAINATGQGPLSNGVQVVITLAAPTLTATPGNALVNLSWTTPSGATGYILSRSNSSSGPFSAIYTGANNAFTDLNVVNGNTYYYEVVATAPNVQSPASNVASATPSDNSTSWPTPIQSGEGPINGSGGGPVNTVYLADPPWMQGTLPVDVSPAPGLGPVSGFTVDLPFGTLDFDSGPDIAAFNPIGPSASFERLYRTPLANGGVSSPGLPAGWVHNYDVKLILAQNGTDLVLVYPNGATDYLTASMSGGQPTGTLVPPTGAPYSAQGTFSGGSWQSVTISSGGDQQDQFTQQVSDPAGTLRLSLVETITDQTLSIAYDGYSRISSVTNSAQTALLTFAYSQGLLSSVSDNQGRTVYYAYSGGELASVSVAGIPSSTYWSYGYAQLTIASGAQVNYLNLAVTAGGMGGARSASVSYDPNTGYAYQLIDANGNERGYVFSPGSTAVMVFPPGKNINTYFGMQNASGYVNNWAVGFDSLARGTTFTDAASDVSGCQYTAPDPADLTYFLKAGDVNPTTISYDKSGATGNPVRITPPYGNQTVENITWNYPASFPCGLPYTLQEGTKAPYRLNFWTSASDPSAGEFAGQIQSMLMPCPGVTNGSLSTDVTVQYTYTSLGDIASISAPSAALNSSGQGYQPATLNFQYASSEVVGEPVSISDSLSNTSSLTWDGSGRLVTYYDPDGNETSELGFPYPGIDQPTSMYFGGNGISASAALQYGSVFAPPTGISLNGGQGFSQVLNYGNEWETLGSTFPLVVSALYDPEYNLTNLNWTLGGSTFAYTYSPSSLQRTVSLLYGNTWTYQYSPSGMLASVQDPNQASAAVTSAEQLQNACPIGPTTDDRPGQINFAQGSSQVGAGVTLTYDAYGRVATVSDDGIAGFAYTYDDLDELTSVTETSAGSGTAPNASIYYSYFPNGERQCMYVVPQGGSTGLAYSYSYDADGNMTAVSVGTFAAGNGPPSGVTPAPIYGAGVAYTFDPDGQVTRAASGTVDAYYSLNGFGQVTSLTNQAPGSNIANSGTVPVFSNFGYPSQIQYDATDSPSSMPFQVNSNTGAALWAGAASYQTDMSDELDAELWNFTTGQQEYDNGLGDAGAGEGDLGWLRGNAFTIQQTLGDTQQGISNTSNDQITNGPNNTSFSYDADGNLLSANPWTSISWDPRGGISQIQAASFNNNPAVSASYCYTTDGWRSAKQGGTDPQGQAQNYTFLYDGDELIGEFNPSSNAFVHAYVWGATGLNTRITNPVSGAPTILGYSFDPFGNVVGRHPLNGQAPIESAQLFDAFGQLIYHNDFFTTDESCLSDPIGYKGQFGYYTDQEIAAPYNLVYCHNRYYSPYLGRWMSRDPSFEEGGINVYAFCGNNPIKFSDPSGLSVVPGGPSTDVAHYNPGSDGSALLEKWGVQGGGSDVPWYDLQFNWANSVHGLATGWGAVEYVFSRGEYGGEYANEPGFGTSVVLTKVGVASATAAVIVYAGPAALATAGAYGRAAIGLAGALLSNPSCLEEAAEEAPPQVDARVANMLRGQQAHVQWQATLGDDWEAEFRLPSGRRIDAVNFGTGEAVELKPNNPVAIARGGWQIAGYLDELGTFFPEINWGGWVEVY